MIRKLRSRRGEACVPAVRFRKRELRSGLLFPIKFPLIIRYVQKTAAAAGAKMP
ncbi:hypothetical protein [Compostibacter hankyongensis]|uniref:hypothetical protein n=1 Tax=Compostibacter hankyongensis TaxID=1007089 RepID=UPI0031E705EB